MNPKTFNTQGVSSVSPLVKAYKFIIERRPSLELIRDNGMGSITKLDPRPLGWQWILSVNGTPRRQWACDDKEAEDALLNHLLSQFPLGYCLYSVSPHQWRVAPESAMAYESAHDTSPVSSGRTPFEAVVYFWVTFLSPLPPVSKGPKS